MLTSQFAYKIGNLTIAVMRRRQADNIKMDDFKWRGSLLIWGPRYLLLRLC